MPMAISLALNKNMLTTCQALKKKKEKRKRIKANRNTHASKTKPNKAAEADTEATLAPSSIE